MGQIKLNMLNWIVWVKMDLALKVVWFQVFFSNIDDIYTVIFLPNTNNFWNYIKNKAQLILAQNKKYCRTQ